VNRDCKFRCEENKLIKRKNEHNLCTFLYRSASLKSKLIKLKWYRT